MGFATLKVRAPRKRVRLHGRLRENFDWQDISIRDLSKRGLMAEAENPPGRGQYIEIRRYDQILIGRVVWRDGQRFGVLLAQQIDPNEIIAGVADKHANDRRNYQTRPEACSVRIIEKPSDWRWLGQTFERISITGLGAAFVTMLAYAVVEFLSTPAQAINAALHP